MTYAKYEFPPDQIPDLANEVDGQYCVLGYLTKDPAVLDAEGSVITPAVISDKIAVDILWRDKATARTPYQVNRVLPKKHLHWVFGMENYYENKGV